MADLTKNLKDAAYITVGLGVIGFQKAQVRRQELRKQLTTQFADTREQVQKFAKEVEGRVEPVIDLVEDRLPEQAKDLVKQTRETAKVAQGQLLSLVGRAS